MSDRPAIIASVREPRSSMDDVIDCYKKDVDRSLLREALKLSPSERLLRLVDLQRATSDLRSAGKKAFE